MNKHGFPLIEVIVVIIMVIIVSTTLISYCAGTTLISERNKNSSYINQTPNKPAFDLPIGKSAEPKKEIFTGSETGKRYLIVTSPTGQTTIHPMED